MLVRRLSLYVACLFSFFFFATAVAQQPSSNNDESQFRFRFVGPRTGNRIASVAGIPGDPSTYYAGAASGGVWKSTDGGNRWDADLRQADCRRDRRAGGRSFAAENRMGRHRRSLGDPRQRRDGQRDLQVDRRRQNLDATWACRSRAASAASSCTPPIPTSSSPACWAAPPARSRSAACIAPPMAARTGSEYCLPTRTPAAPACRSTRRIRIPCSPACGRWRCIPGPSSAAAPAAACMLRTMAARPGSASKATACRTRPWARSMSPSRRPIPTGSTR